MVKIGAELPTLSRKKLGIRFWTILYTSLFDTSQSQRNNTQKVKQ